MNSSRQEQRPARGLRCAPSAPAATAAAATAYVIRSVLWSPCHSCYGVLSLLPEVICVTVLYTSTSSGVYVGSLVTAEQQSHRGSREESTCL